MEFTFEKVQIHQQNESMKNSSIFWLMNLNIYHCYVGSAYLEKLEQNCADEDEISGIAIEINFIEAFAKYFMKY